MKQIYETWLPVFPGFYGTIFEASEDYEIDCINEVRESNGLDPLTWDDIEFDYSQYETDVVESCINVLECELTDFVSRIKLQCINSPKEYNFANDSANIEIKIKPMEISKFINTNFDSFTKYIHDRYTSRSGFWSHYSNNANDWKE